MLVRHKLTEKNEEELTATCSECGPCDIVRMTRGNYQCRAALSRTHTLKRANKYGLTLEQYEENMRKPCEICGRQDLQSQDHSHRTGRARGTLCAPHNRTLGNIGDGEEAETIISFLKYIDKHNPELEIFKRIQEECW